MRTDYQIYTNLEEVYRNDEVLNCCDIGIAVKNGIVTLYGFVDVYQKKRRAEQLARTVEGVEGIAQEIHVRCADEEGVTDAELAAEVVNVLEGNPFVTDQHLAVRVEESWVYLEGEVDNMFMRNEAYAALRVVPGVKGIINLIHVRSNTQDR